MIHKIITVIFILTLLFLTVFSYGFVDANFPLKPWQTLLTLIHFYRPFSTLIYIFLVASLFGVYGYLLWRVRSKKIDSRELWRLIFVAVGILFFSFPAFSYDIFNYIATAKVAFFYKENPYLVMPIEFLDEPMLKFLHAANKTALYGPAWILLTFIPYTLGLGNLILTVFTFKAFISLFYLWIIWLIWRLSGKNLTSIVLFAFNPLTLIEILVSSHNDVVMMTFALLAFYLIFRKKRFLSFLALLLSIGIKYATTILIPVFLLQKKFSRGKIFIISYWLMFLVFLTSPIREEIYPWYVIWLITFTALILKNKFIFWLTLALSLGTLLRYVPFLYTGTWEGITPLIKKIVTIVPPILVIFIFLGEKLWSKRFSPF